ncbi:MAG: hypothetical protein JNK64_03000 [Myxococcales bacterium]|nr:hypothetical protein [Myxococcales bacterium]
MVLSLGATLAEDHRAEGNEARPAPRCPPAPTVVVDGTVLEVDVPRARCWPELVATGGETCLTARLVGCANGVTATVRSAGRLITTPSSITAVPGAPRLDRLRVCALSPDTYDVTLCANDAEPITCAVAVGAGQTIDVRASRPLPTVRVRVKVDAVVLGEAGAELTFTGARPYRVGVGERGRFALYRTTFIATPPMVTDYAEYECYERYPPPVARRGCAGCSGGDGIEVDLGVLIPSVLLALGRHRRAHGRGRSPARDARRAPRATRRRVARRATAQPLPGLACCVRRSWHRPSGLGGSGARTTAIPAAGVRSGETARVHLRRWVIHCATDAERPFPSECPMSFGGAARLLLVLLLSFVSACCGRGVSPVKAVPAPPLAGRSRAVAFECSDTSPKPEEYPMTCAIGYEAGHFWPSIEPPRELAPGQLVYDPIGWPMESCLSGIALCGIAFEAPAGSHALVCRGADKRLDGPVEVVAPDGSLLVQGFCVEGFPAGTWLEWKHGELARTRRGWGTAPATTAHEGVQYTAPGVYTYETHKLVPPPAVAR